MIPVKCTAYATAGGMRSRSGVGAVLLLLLMMMMREGEGVFPHPVGGAIRRLSPVHVEGFRTRSTMWMMMMMMMMEVVVVVVVPPVTDDGGIRPPGNGRDPDDSLDDHRVDVGGCARRRGDGVVPRRMREVVRIGERPFAQHDAWDGRAGTLCTEGWVALRSRL